MNGKGSKRRPEAKSGNFIEGYERIFGDDHRSGPTSHKGAEDGSIPSVATSDREILHRFFPWDDRFFPQEAEEIS